MISRTKGAGNSKLIRVNAKEMVVEALEAREDEAMVDEVAEVAMVMVKVEVIGLRNTPITLDPTWK